MSLLALPVNVQHTLLAHLPDLRALHALVRASRAFYAAFKPRRARVLRAVAENALGIELGAEFIVVGDSESASDEPVPDASVCETIKFLLTTRPVVLALEPIVFALLPQPDAEPPRRPSATESHRLRRAAYRFAWFCELPSALRQSAFLAHLDTIEVFELAHYVDGLRGMVSVILEADVGGQNDAKHDDDEYGGGARTSRISRLVSTGPATIWRLWTLRPVPAQSQSKTPAEFREALAAAAGPEEEDSDGYDDAEGAFDGAVYHFEVARNISAFDAARTHALLDAGHAGTQDALVKLGRLMEAPPVPPPTPPRRAPFLTLLPRVALHDGPAPDFDNPFSSNPFSASPDSSSPESPKSNALSTRLPFLPARGHLNSLPVRSHIPYCVLALNGAPRVMPVPLSVSLIPASLPVSASRSPVRYASPVRCGARVGEGEGVKMGI
ncbi:hypothetical protein FB451DRAFT_1549870 [Mycena latifolia]|nr:hypothetical protein FB451DRAFT_1549870 [Mycena latifolia]